MLLVLARSATDITLCALDLVNLGYAKHIPTIVSEAASGSKLPIYKNIRFANALTAELRLLLPSTDLPTIDGV